MISTDEAFPIWIYCVRSFPSSKRLQRVIAEVITTLTSLDFFRGEKLFGRFKHNIYVAIHELIEIADQESFSLDVI